MLLPACYVAVPFLTAMLAAGRRPRAADLLVLAGLYSAFVGRIVLKDFRDVRGDALFGKRTFLVRHGRVVICRFSAAFWLVGTGILTLAAGRHAVAFDVTAALAALATLTAGQAVVMLRSGPRGGHFPCLITDVAGWSGRRESNPRNQFGRLRLCH